MKPFTHLVLFHIVRRNKVDETVYPLVLFHIVRRNKVDETFYPPCFVPSNEINKVSLSCFDDKRYLLGDGVSSNAYGHYKIIE